MQEPSTDTGNMPVEVTPDNDSTLPSFSCAHRRVEQGRPLGKARKHTVTLTFTLLHEPDHEVKAAAAEHRK